MKHLQHGKRYPSGVRVCVRERVRCRSVRGRSTAALARCRPSRVPTEKLYDRAMCVVEPCVFVCSLDLRRASHSRTSACRLGIEAAAAPTSMSRFLPTLGRALRETGQVRFGACAPAALLLCACSVWLHSCTVSRCSSAACVLCRPYRINPSGTNRTPCRRWIAWAWRSRESKAFAKR